jgi:anti-anti-sigma factor
MPDHTARDGSLQEANALRVDVLPERDVVRVVPVGELDMAGAAELATQLQELRESGFDRVVLDLRCLRLRDSAVIEVILAETRLAHSIGHEFSVVGAAPALQLALSAPAR